MERLTAPSFNEIIILVLLALLVLIAQTAALCWGAARLDRHRIRRSLPEVSALAVVLCLTLFLSGGWRLYLMGLSPQDWITDERMAASVAAICTGIFAMRWTPRRGALLTAAGVCALPYFDHFLPISAICVLTLLAGRLLLLLRHARAQRTGEVTVASIREGLDLLPDGILLARTDHSAVLVNIAMLCLWSGCSGGSIETPLCFGRLSLHLTHLPWQKNACRRTPSSFASPQEMHGSYSAYISREGLQAGR